MMWVGLKVDWWAQKWAVTKAAMLVCKMAEPSAEMMADEKGRHSVVRLAHLLAAQLAAQLGRNWDTNWAESWGQH